LFLERQGQQVTAEGHMAKLRHFALVCRDIDKTAKFYEEVFDFKRVGRDDLPFGSGIYLSDGTVNLALLTGGGGDKEKVYGPNHFGVIVDNLAEAQEKIEAAGGTFYFEFGESKDHMNFEKKFKDPEGTTFDISEKGWLGTTK
jgi:predicted enzyme related to lactoylglutathione lyase